VSLGFTPSSKTCQKGKGEGTREGGREGKGREGKGREGKVCGLSSQSPAKTITDLELSAHKVRAKLPDIVVTAPVQVIEIWKRGGWNSQVNGQEKVRTDRKI
jgi:hypothetical protein